MESTLKLIDSEASDKTLANSNPKKLIFFLLGVKHYAESNYLSNIRLYCLDTDVNFRVEADDVCREVCINGEKFRDEHLNDDYKELCPGISYSLQIKECKRIQEDYWVSSFGD